MENLSPSACSDSSALDELDELRLPSRPGGGRSDRIRIPRHDPADSLAHGDVDSGPVQETQLSAETELKIRTRVGALTLTDPGIMPDSRGLSWSLVDRASGETVCGGFRQSGEAAFFARAPEYVRILLAEVDRLRQLVPG